MPASGRRFADLFAGAVLGLGAVAVLVLVMHHPVVHASAPEAIVSGINRLADLDRTIHGLLIGLMALMTLGFLHLTQRLGFERPAAAAGFVGYALGVVLVSIAGVLDGFVLPDLTAHCIGAGPDCSRTALDLLRLCAVAVQDFTKVGLVAQSLAIACWGIAFLNRRDPKGVAGLGLGLAGLAAGLAPAAVMIFEPFRFTPTTLALVFAGQAAWQLCVAAFLILARRRAQA